MNMLLVGIVLLAVLSVFCYNEARIERAMLSDDLSRSISFLQTDPFREIRDTFPVWQEDGEAPVSFYIHGKEDTAPDGQTDDKPNDDTGRFAKDSGRMPSGIVAVTLDSSGNYRETYSNGLTLSDEALAQAVSCALADPSGTLTEIKSQGLFYQAVTIDGVTYAAFADAAGYHDSVQETIIKSTVLWLVIMTLFLLISMFMAKVAVKPVKESWDRQQEFVADASHELKTPLTVILANNNILLSPERDLSEDDRKWIESNQDEAAHMKALVDQLLFLARSDSGDQKMLLSDLDLGDMIMGDVLQFEPVAFERGILIEPDLEPDTHIEGDSTMIKQLIHILLDNACKYAAENGTIHVNLKKERQGCTFSVNNPGQPIPAEDLPHIFERFYRADKARTYQDGTSGYGLGLAIAQSIAQDHNGTISCTSTEEDGTTFTVRFRERLH